MKNERNFYSFFVGRFDRVHLGWIHHPVQFAEKFLVTSFVAPPLPSKNLLTKI